MKADAWDGANRTLLYLCVFAIFAWRRIRPALGLALLGSFATATAAVGVIELLRAVAAARADGFFISGRLAVPITYPNANAALFLAPLFPAVVVASRRGAHPLARALLLAVSGVLVELATLCQSRASLALG